MDKFFNLIFITTLWIWAIHILFQENHLLEKPGEWITKVLGEKWSKPIINCPVCMSSVWGIIFYVSLPWWFKITIKEIPFFPFIFCLCGLNVIISKLVSKERIIIDE